MSRIILLFGDLTWFCTVCLERAKMFWKGRNSGKGFKAILGHFREFSSKAKSIRKKYFRKVEKRSCNDKGIYYSVVL